MAEKILTSEDKKELQDYMKTLLEENSTFIKSAEGTEIAITDGADAPLYDFNVYGKAEQKEYNGYQLFDANAIPSLTNGDCEIINNGDGSITIKGEGVTGSTSIYKIKEYTHEETLKMLKSGTITLKTEQITYPYLLFTLATDNANFSELNTSGAAVHSKEITEEILSYDDVRMIVGIYGGAGKPIKPGTIRPMLYQDGDGTWEPFTGGIPSPNSDYPQEIVNVGKYNETTGKYEVEVTVKGKQMFKYPFYETTKTESGVTFTDNGDGTITINGTATKDVDFSIAHSWGNKVIDAKIGTKYAMSCECLGSINGEVVFRVQDITYKQTQTIYIGESLRKEFTADYNKYYSWIRVMSGAVLNNYTVKPMLRRADIGDDTFEQYKKHKEILELDEPLRATKDGSLRDKLYWDGTVERCIKEKMFNGSPNEGWDIGASSYFLNSSLSDRRNGTPCIVNNLSHSSALNGDYVGWWADNPNNTLFVITGLIETGIATTVEELLVWLADNPVQLQYVLATPTTGTLPESEIAKLKRLQTFNPTTIFTNSDEVEMEIQYATDSDMLRYIAKNYVPLATHEALQARVLELEQNALN